MHTPRGLRKVVGPAVAVLAGALLHAGTAGAALPTTFPLDPRRTYLRTSSDAPLDALKVDLGALGIASGSTIRLERLGAWDCGSPCNDTVTAMIGVFSAGTVLLAPAERHRVPGAIEAGVDVPTSPTFYGSLPTDIPEDFDIADTAIRVPPGATHLFVGARDSLYYDNTDPNGDFALRISVVSPDAADDSYTVDEDTTLTVAAPGVLANDGDPQAQPLTAVLETAPTNGSLSLNPDGSFAYTPNANVSGGDSFTYRASDGTFRSPPATVTVTVNPVNDAPVAAGDVYTVDEDTPLSVTAPGVLANDGDAEGDALAAVLVSGPAHGALTLNPDGSFIYQPGANFSGVDGFVYRARDGAAFSGDAAVTITVNPVNDRPVASADGPYSGVVGSPIAFDGSASADIEGSALVYRWSFGDGTTLVTTSPNPTHAYAAAGIYTVGLVVGDGSLDSAPTTTTATVGNPIGSNSGDVDAFLSYAAPTQRSVQLPAGTAAFEVTVIYGGTIDPATFAVELNGRPLAAFSPSPGTSQTVAIPLSPGRNVLALSVTGMLPDGRRATDRDRLTFAVG